jgi:hypothetical protein
MKKVTLVLLAVFATSLCFAQTASTTYTFALAPVSVPGLGQTVAGTEAIVAVQISNSVSLGETNIIAPGNNFQYFGGRGFYQIDWLSKKLNNISPTLNGLQFQFIPTLSVGVGRITAPVTQQHIGFTAGGIVNYRFGASGTWALGGKVEYAKFPGLKNNGWIASFGPSLHF